MTRFLQGFTNVLLPTTITLAAVDQNVHQLKQKNRDQAAATV